jgi:RHS repeat-associated protein
MTASGQSQINYTFENYTGRESDGLGLHYYRARYYNPNTGRFISEDPMGLAAGPNEYTYALGSPTNFRDPHGTFVEGCLIGMAGYGFGQALNGLAGRKMATGWNAAKGLGENCLLGIATEGLTAWAADFLALDEAAQAIEDAESVEAPAMTCCFAAGTPVHTKRGIVPVEKIKVGDLVLSRNRATGKIEYKLVSALTKPHQDKLLEMRVEGEAKPLHPTADHPFWVKRGSAKDGDWVEAGKMLVGDLVETIKGKWVKVLSITPIPGQRTVYNFEVDDDHDYFVGSEGLLVHNAICDLLALGKTNGLSQFAEGMGADSYDTLNLPQGLSAVTDILQDEDVQIAINLQDAGEELDSLEAGLAPDTAFGEELQWVLQNSQTWNRITWYQGGKVVANPFLDWLTSDGPLQAWVGFTKNGASFGKLRFYGMRRASRPFYCSPECDYCLEGYRVMARSDLKLCEFREMPWHRFGTRLPRVPTAGEALRIAGLDWTIAKKGECAGLLPGRCLLVREDIWKGSSEGVLGSVRTSAFPFQNVEAFSLFDPFVKSGALLYDSLGQFHSRNGEFRIWLVLRLSSDIMIAPKEYIARFLLFVHYPTSGYYRLTYLPVRVANQNILVEDVSHNPEPMVTIPKIRPRRFVESDNVVLEQIDLHFADFSDKFLAMFNVKVDTRQADNYFMSVFNTFVTEQRKLKRSVPDEREIQEGRLGCRQIFDNGMQDDRRLQRGTLWAAYNAFIEHCDQHRVNQGAPEFIQEIWFSPLKACALRIAAKEALAGA